jgi:hypothetical protein
MFYYPNILAKYEKTDLESFIWVCIEEIKRLNIALYKVCGKARSITDESHDGTDSVWSSLTAGELQFPLPSNCSLWNAVSRDEWTALANGDKLVSLDDTCEERWISNFAEVLEVFV